MKNLFKKPFYAFLALSACLTAGTLSAKTVGEKVDQAIEKTEDAAAKVEAKVKDKAQEAEKKAKDKANEIAKKADDLHDQAKKKAHQEIEKH